MAFHGHGGTPKWMAYKGKSYMKKWTMTIGVALFWESAI